LTNTQNTLWGTFLLALGVWLTLYGWQVVAEDGWFNVAGTIFGPATILLGALLVAFPGYRNGRLARGEDPEALQGWAMLMPRWKVVTVIAIGLGLFNYMAMQPGVTPVL